MLKENKIYMFKYIKIVLILTVVFSVPFNNVLAEDVLSWQDCVKEAAKNHPDLIAAVEEVKQSQAEKSITASTLFPQITGSVSGATSKATSKTSGSSTADLYSYGLSATQLIFDGSKTINNVRATSETIKASQQNYRFTSTEVRLRLRTAFVNLIRAQELIKVSEDIIKIRKDNYEMITLRYESGLEHKGALLTAEANLAQAIFDLAQAKRDVVLAQRQMTKEMGRTAFIPMSVTVDFKVKDAAIIKPDIEALARTNPSLLQATAQKNAAEFGIRSAYANFFPTLTGSASAGKTGSHFWPRDEERSLGLSLSLPIFEGGLRLAQVSQAQALYNQLKENERSTKDGIVVSLEQAWVSLRDAVETIDVQYKSLLATEERSKIAEAEYATGFITYDNWTIIEDNLVQAKINYLDAQTNALLAEANWIQAKGEVLEYAKT
jgi:TolC family type I secretion outer membrane protein